MLLGPLTPGRAWSGADVSAPPTPAFFLVAQGMVLLEAIAFFASIASYWGLAVFSLDARINLPRGLQPRALAGFKGSSDNVTWRVVNGEVLFRRRVNFWRRPMSFGRLSLGPDGRATVRWAPFPIASWPILILLIVQIVLSSSKIEGATRLALFAMPFVALIVQFVGSQRALLTVLLPELERALQEHLRAREARGFDRG